MLVLYSSFAIRLEPTKLVIKACPVLPEFDDNVTELGLQFEFWMVFKSIIWNPIWQKCNLHYPFITLRRAEESHYMVITLYKSWLCYLRNFYSMMNETRPPKVKSAIMAREMCLSHIKRIFAIMWGIVGKRAYIMSSIVLYSLSPPVPSLVGLWIYKYKYCQSVIKGIETWIGWVTLPI